MKLAILDDYQDLALKLVDWDPLRRRGVAIERFLDAFETEDEAAMRLAPFDLLLLMRERTAFPGSLVRRLPNLKMISLTGNRSPTLDAQACAERGIPISHTGGARTLPATAELAWALLMGCARSLGRADRTMRAGGWHAGLPAGTILAGARLGVLGLGRLGSLVAGYGRAFGMEVVAWSQNLTAENAAAAGARLVGKDELMATSDAISIHLVSSARTAGLVGAADIARMKPGAILVNTSRGPIVDETALVEALRAGRIVAGLDVYDREPLPAGHPLRGLDNALLTPHLGYVAEEVYRAFYRDSLENFLAFLDGAPIRLLNADRLSR